jgi:LysM repeat protein
VDIIRILFLLILVIGLVFVFEHDHIQITVVVPVTGEVGENCSGTYTLTENDTIFDIAYRCHLSTSEIVQANPGHRDINDFFPGEIITLPGSGPFPGIVETPQKSVPVTAGAMVYTAENYQEYTVRGEDTLKSIARTKGTSVEKIRELNLCLANDTRVIPGQVLLLPR